MVRFSIAVDGLANAFCCHALPTNRRCIFPAGLLLHNLSVFDGCHVMFHSSDVPSDHFPISLPSPTRALEPSPDVDLTSLRPQLAALRQLPADLSIAPAIGELYALLGQPAAAPGSALAEAQRIVAEAAATAGTLHIFGIEVLETVYCVYLLIGTKLRLMHARIQTMQSCTKLLVIQTARWISFTSQPAGPAPRGANSAQGSTGTTMFHSAISSGNDDDISGGVDSLLFDGAGGRDEFDGPAGGDDYGVGDGGGDWFGDADGGDDDDDAGKFSNTWALAVPMPCNSCDCCLHVF